MAAADWRQIEDPAVRTYYELLQARPGAFDPERFREILAENLVFEGPLAGRRVGAEPFIRGVRGFVETAQGLTILQALHAGDMTATLYDAEMPGGAVRFAEFLPRAPGEFARSTCCTTPHSIDHAAAGEAGTRIRSALPPSGQPTAILPGRRAFRQWGTRVVRSGFPQ